MQGSVILTMGSALTRAEQDGTEVAVLVQGEWFRGHVQGLDGHGLRLDDGQGHDLLVRLEHVAVLQIDQEKDTWVSAGVDGDAALLAGPAGQPDIPRPRAVEGSELTL
jgi:hypothetical protein